jgi:hypothetical protein
VTGVEKTNNFLVPDTVRISSRESDFLFGMFVRRSGEAFDLIGQLANLVLVFKMLLKCFDQISCLTNLCDGVAITTATYPFMNPDKVWVRR